MSIVTGSSFLKSALYLLLPPILMSCFSVAERSYVHYESGVLLLLGALFICGLALSIIQLSKVARRVGFWYSIIVSVFLASGSFWGPMIGVEPNIHGPSMWLWFLYLFTAWGLSAYLVVAAVWRLLFNKQVRRRNR